jgi:hypothetical protein
VTIHHKVSGAWRTVSQPKLKLQGAWRDASAMYTKVDGVWRQTWPANTGTPRIVGVAYRGQTEYLPGIPGSDFRHIYPAGAPRYNIVGDTSQINSARVEIKMTPVSPKSPKEHILVWDVAWDWGIYKVSWRVDASTTKYYIAGMTHAEAAAIALPKYASLLWSPRGGGWFAYMPVCFDQSGVTVPMRDDAAGGLDAHSGYAPFPPGRSAIKTADSTAVSLVDDYTVANGYTDQEASNGYFGYSAPAITLITIILRNSGGGVLSQYGPVALPYNTDGVHIPGLGVGPATFSALGATMSSEPPQELYYWPEEWRGLFDRLDTFGQAYTVVWGRDIPNKGEGEWDVLDRDGVKIGDFRLAMMRGNPGIVEIRGVNLAQDLVGLGIMKTIVAYGVEWCPTEDVIITPPDEATKQVMMSWGWREMTELSPFSHAVLPNQYRENLDKSLYMRSDPMYNRFVELGFPTWQEVAQ